MEILLKLTPIKCSFIAFNGLLGEWVDAIQGGRSFQILSFPLNLQEMRCTGETWIVAAN